MILLGGIPTGIYLGSPGWLPADIPTGPPPSPLANDFTLPADAGVDFIWWLTSPLATSGLTLTTDQGAYNLIGAANGVHTQGYGILFMPPTGAPSIEYGTITTTVGAAPPSPPLVTQQPSAQSVSAGQAAAFTFAFSGATSVQAQRRANSSAAWQNVSGATLTGYTTPATSSGDNGFEYRFGATGPGGGPVYTNTVTLTVSTSQPTLVNPEEFYDMLPRVLPYATDCPPQTAEFHLRLVATDFFQRTLAWREDLAPVATVVGQESYALPLPQHAAVAKLMFYTFDGDRFHVIDAEAGLELALEESGMSISWTHDRVTARIAPVPTEAGKVLGFRVALKPSLNATQIPGNMHEHYIDHIVEGVLARLLSMPKKTWTDIGAADRHRAAYELAVARVGLMTAKGFSRRRTQRAFF